MSTTAWRATCIQMVSQPAFRATSATDAEAVIQSNVAHGLDLLSQVMAAAPDTRLGLFPEFAFQGPPRSESVAEWIGKGARPLPGPISRPLQDKARDYGIYIGANQFETDPEWPGRFFNCCFLIAPSGEVVLRYRRIYTAQWPSPHDFMDQYLTRYGLDGTFPVVETELGKIAMYPCGEVMVPEASRMFMLRGAEVLLHPDNGANSPAGEAAKATRAAENMMYFVSCNVAGPIGFSDGGQREGGGSCVFDFDGRQLAYAPSAAESLAVSAVIDIGALRAARRDPTMRNRLVRTRFEIYRPLYDQAVFYPANQFAEVPMPRWESTAPVVEQALANMVSRGVTTPLEEPSAEAAAVGSRP
jgi:predicted amidohydrolase